MSGVPTHIAVEPVASTRSKHADERGRRRTPARTRTATSKTHDE